MRASERWNQSCCDGEVEVRRNTQTLLWNSIEKSTPFPHQEKVHVTVDSEESGESGQAGLALFMGIRLLRLLNVRGTLQIHRLCHNDSWSSLQG